MLSNLTDENRNNPRLQLFTEFPSILHYMKTGTLENTLVSMCLNIDTFYKTFCWELLFTTNKHTSFATLSLRMDFKKREQKTLGFSV